MTFKSQSLIDNPFTNLSPQAKKILWIYLAFYLFSMGRRFFLVWLIDHPLVYNTISGSYTAAVTAGAHGTNYGNVILTVCASVPILVTTSLLTWTLGAELGKPFLDFSAQHSPRMQKVLNWMFRIKHRYILSYVALSQIPCIPFIGISSMIAGAVRINRTLFVTVRVAAALIVNGILAYLGYIYGDVVLSVIDIINKYANYITIAIIVVTVISTSRKTAQRTTAVKK